MVTTQTLRTSRRRGKWILSGVAMVLILPVMAIVCSTIIVKIAAAGHVYDSPADAPPAPVVIVLGAQVRDGQPLAFLAGRLNVAIELIREKKVEAVLVSGDRGGTSGDEIAAMTGYLTDKGINPAQIVGDPYGLDTHDTCVRAATVYRINKALITTQGYHVPRAVAECRDAGIDTDGINADCGCDSGTLIKNTAREWILSRPNAVLDLIRDRDPEVSSPPEDSIAHALHSINTR